MNFWGHIMVSNLPTPALFVEIKDGSNVFPLYLYPEINKQSELSESRRNIELRLEEARVIFENFKQTFSTIKKMFESAPNPDKEVKQYYKEQEKHYQKLSSDVEKFKQQLASISTLTLFEEEKRKPNLKPDIVKQIAEKLGLKFLTELPNVEPLQATSLRDNFAPIDILDYIYAVLHSPAYREKYKELLKIDFPRVPYPKDKETFWQLVKLGGEIRQIHLLESPVLKNYITQFPVDGNYTVTKPYKVDKHGSALVRVYINESQYFDNVPLLAWEFYIGGYQPAQKWLKDHKGRTLSNDDLDHYQKIIKILLETDRLMKEIG
jgi:hypothetical protein